MVKGGEEHVHRRKRERNEGLVKVEERGKERD